MHNGEKDEKIPEQSARHYSRLKKIEERHLNITRIFIHDMDGMIQSILGNTELLKVQYAHKFNREAMSYLYKVEKNSKSLVNLLNTFQDTIPLAPKNTTNNPVKN